VRLRNFAEAVIRSWNRYKLRGTGTQLIEMIRPSLRSVDRATDRLARQWNGRTKAVRRHVSRPALLAVVLLILAATTGMGALSLMRAGTALASPPVTLGQVKLYSSDPAASITVEVSFWHQIGDGGFADVPFLVGYSSANAMRLRIHQMAKTAEKLSWALILTGDARLSHVIGAASITTYDLDAIQITGTQGSYSVFGCPCQVITGTLEDERFTPAIEGYLQQPASVTAGATTAVGIPAFFSSPTSSAETWQSGQSFLGTWYGPKEGNFVVRLGPLRRLGSSADSRPPLTSDPSRWPYSSDQRWEGNNLFMAQAVFTDVAGQQQQSKQLFAAGVLAGIAGGLLIESILVVLNLSGMVGPVGSHRNRRQPGPRSLRRRVIPSSLSRTRQTGRRRRP
jgi:hypothetical protein